MEIHELKELILWCKANKVKHLTKGDFTFELSDLAFIDQLMNEPVKETNLDSSKTLADTEELGQEEQDELLFWSTSK